MSCPKCGGTTGIEFFHDERWSKCADWSGGNVDGEFEKVVYSSSPKCADCGAYVSKDLLKSYERGYQK